MFRAEAELRDKIGKECDWAGSGTRGHLNRDLGFVFEDSGEYIAACKIAEAEGWTVISGEGD